jgi:hypothetical protein
MYPSQFEPVSEFAFPFELVLPERSLASPSHGISPNLINIAPSSLLWKEPFARLLYQQRARQLYER